MIRSLAHIFRAHAHSALNDQLHDHISWESANQMAQLTIMSMLMSTIISKRRLQ